MFRSSRALCSDRSRRGNVSRTWLGLRGRPGRQGDSNLFNQSCDVQQFGVGWLLILVMRGELLGYFDDWLGFYSELVSLSYHCRRTCRDRWHFGNGVDSFLFGFCWGLTYVEKQLVAVSLQVWRLQFWMPSLVIAALVLRPWALLRLMASSCLHWLECSLC